MEGEGAMKCVLSKMLSVIDLWAGTLSWCRIQLLMRHFSGWWLCVQHCGGIAGLLCKNSVSTLFSRDDEPAHQCQKLINMVFFDRWNVYHWDDNWIVFRPYSYTQLSLSVIIQDMKFWWFFARSWRSVETDIRVSFSSTVRKWSMGYAATCLICKSSIRILWHISWLVVGSQL